jgi:uncharacterized protein
VDKYYILPFVMYLAGTALASQFPQVYPLLYFCVVILTAGLLIRCWRFYEVVKPHWKILDAVAVGILGIALWVFLCQFQFEAMLAESLPTFLQPKPRVGLNPFEQISSRYVWGFIFIRLIGLAILVPAVEEIFWRGFLARWLVSEKWEEIPIGKFTVSSFLFVTLLFTTAHPEWIAAAVYCSLLNGYLIWKKDLWSCIVAHGVSNLVLGIYVLATAQYQLW